MLLYVWGRRNTRAMCVRCEINCALSYIFVPTISLSPLFHLCTTTHKCRIKFWGVLPVSAPYLPWFLLGFSVLFGHSPRMDLIGIFVGHVYYFFEDIYPAMADLHRWSVRRPLKTPSIMCVLVLSVLCLLLSGCSFCMPEYVHQSMVVFVLCNCHVGSDFFFNTDTIFRATRGSTLRSTIFKRQQNQRTEGTLTRIDS